MENSLFQRVRESNNFSVGVMWITILTSCMLYGAVVPLLPIYLEEFNKAKISENVTSANERNNYTNLTINSTLTGCQEQQTNSKTLSVSSSTIIGTVIALQKWTQLFVGPLVGPLVDNIGYDIPLFIGYVVFIVSSIGFALATNVWHLYLSRGLQGICSSFMSTASLCVISDLFKDDDIKRGIMIGNVMSAIPLGLALGPPFGSVALEFGQKSAPFLILAVMILIVAMLQLCIRIPRVQVSQRSHNSEPPMNAQIRLIKNPYVLCCAMLYLLGLISMAFMEAAIPLHMVMHMCTQNWMLGLVFLPIYIGSIIGSPFLGWLSRYLGRWNIAFVSFIIQAGTIVAYPFCENFTELLGPGIPYGLSMSGNNVGVLPFMSYFVDKQIGGSVYGSAYALIDFAISISFGLGPILSGLLMPVIGFPGIMYVASGLTMLALPFMLFLRRGITTTISSDETTKLLNNENVPNGTTNSLALTE